MRFDKDGLEKLKAAYTEVNKDRVTPTQVKRLFDALVDAVQRAKTELLKRVDSALDTLTGKVDAKLANIRSGVDGKDGAPGPTGPIGPTGESIAGPAGENGKDGKEGKDGSPDDAFDIRNKLELLDGEERLDAKAIKNLPEATKKIIQQGVVGHGPIWSMSDVSIAGITSGQHLEWDGVKWIAVTPAGAGGTPVWGEVLHDQGVGTTFTLDNTPLAGTVRLFRGGAYQAAGAGEDYTLSGATITLAVALVDGEKLVSDYSY